MCNGRDQKSDDGRIYALSNFPLLARAVTVLVAAALSFLAGCDNYPKDAGDTLKSINRSILHVGLIENPPWVIDGGGEPAGLEPGIIRNIARELDAEVRWHWGSTAEMIQALEHHQVHVVIGGLTTGPRLPKTVTPTKPYYTTRYLVGFPAGIRMLPEKLKGEVIALPYISPVREILKHKKAELKIVNHPEATGLPIAGPSWKLEAQGYIPGPWVLLKQQHVMVVAKGENAWIGTLQRHLNDLTRAGIDERLRQLENL